MIYKNNTLKDIGTVRYLLRAVMLFFLCLSTTIYSYYSHLTNELLELQYKAYYGKELKI